MPALGDACSQWGLLWRGGGACSRERGCLLPEGGGAWWRHTTPTPGQLLLRAVSILLECMLVQFVMIRFVPRCEDSEFKDPRYFKFNRCMKVCGSP